MLMCNSFFLGILIIPVGMLVSQLIYLVVMEIMVATRMAQWFSVVCRIYNYYFLKLKNFHIWKFF